MEIHLSCIAENAEEDSPTKRNVVGTFAKIYDPLGIVSPITVKLKIFFKKLWREGMEWDEPLSEKLRSEWSQLLRDLKEATPISISRCYLSSVTGDVEEISLRGFCDASVEAYAAVVYLKIKTTDGTFLRFVMSKTRVSPVKIQTIPRLELLSALILARIIVHVRDSLERRMSIGTVACWTDSTVAFCWVLGVTKEWKQFVQNRVLEIRQLVPPESWNHCKRCQP